MSLSGISLQDLTLCQHVDSSNYMENLGDTLLTHTRILCGDFVLIKNEDQYIAFTHSLPNLEFPPLEKIVCHVVATFLTPVGLFCKLCSLPQTYQAYKNLHHIPKENEDRKIQMLRHIYFLSYYLKAGNDHKREDQTCVWQ